MQLEGTELQHGNILLFHLRRLAKERLTDISAEMYRKSCSFQQFGDDGCRSCLSVAPGNGNHTARARLKENFHFRGYDAASLPCPLQMFFKRHQARSAKDHIKVQIFKIVLSQTKVSTESKQLLCLFTHFFRRTFITGCDMAAG